MRLRSTLALGAALALAVGALASRAEAQTTAADACPPGQPCVVVVPQAPPAQPQPPPAQVIVQPQVAPQQSYVTVQEQPIVQPYGAQPVQAREVRRSRMRWGMIVPGIVLTVVGWIGNWITAIPGVITMAFDESHPGQEDTYFGTSFIPVVGPFVGAGFYAGSEHDGYFGMHLLWGVMQSAGILLCILGTVLPEDEVVYEYALGDAPDAPRLAVNPWAGQDGAGLAANLRF